MSPLPPLAPSTRLSPRVIRILGGNPSKFTLQGTNTHLVGTGPARLLIDTAEGKPVWKSTLAEVLRAENARIEAVVLTHWHADHVGGVADVRELQPGVRVYKFWRGRDDSSSSSQSHSEAEADADAEDKEKEKGYLPITPAQTFSVQGATLQATHTPGHTTDHITLTLVEEDALFTGDNVLGHGTAVFEDLAAYMASLTLMRGLFCGRAYPSHGEVIADGPGKIDEYIAHRQQREAEALEVLRTPSPAGDEWWASMEMVRVVYAKYPEEYWAPAEGSLKQVLKKLKGDAKVRQRREEDGKWALVEKAAL